MKPNVTQDDAVRRGQALEPEGRTADPFETRPDRPDLAVDLTERRLAVASMAAFLGIGTDAEAASPTREERPIEVPGYELLGELGRGGMGVVYLARQLNLDRVVALKRILTREHAAAAAQLARFRNEARAVAQARHPNIVQVYGVGEAGGLPYITLEYVRGGSLDRRLKGEPLPCAEAARFMEPLARAVHAAHGRGVVHRDLKPGNILLDEDEGAGLGVPKVTDFGLAKLLDAESNLTMTDSIMGSPSYMAPEQAEGKVREVGPAADVYALGAILYELLTGRPPFRGETPIETLQQIRSDDPVAPSRLAPGVDRDVETIALKCLEKEPGRRYATAAALADDLERFRRGEPISARPLDRVGRAWRWCRRNRAVAALCAAVAASLLAGTAGSLGFALKAEAQREAAEKALAHESEANRRISRARAELDEANRRERARFGLAMDAVRTFHTGVSEDLLLKEPRFRELRDRLLGSANDFYVRLGGMLRDDADLASRQVLLQANFEVAGLAATLGRSDEALAVHRRVRAGREALAARAGAPESAALDAVNSMLVTASLLMELGRWDEASDEYRDAVAYGRRLVDQGRDGVDVKETLAGAHYSQARLFWMTGKVAEADAGFLASRSIIQELAAKEPIRLRGSLAFQLHNHGFLLEARGKAAEAEAAYRESLSLLEAMIADGSSPGAARSRADGEESLARLLSHMGRRDEALAVYREAREAYEKIVAKTPGAAMSVNRLDACRVNLAQALIGVGRTAEAIRELSPAVESYQQLAQADPSSYEHLRGLAIAQDTLADAQRRLGETTEALATREAERATLGRLSRFQSISVETRRKLLLSYHSTADLLRKQGRTAEAGAAYDQAVAVGEPLVRETREEEWRVVLLAKALRRRGVIRLILGDAAGAAADARSAAALWESIPAQDAASSFEAACCHAVMAETAEAGGNEADRAMDLLRRAVALENRDLADDLDERALDSLRVRDDFRALVMDLAMPSDPFVRVE